MQASASTRRLGSTAQRFRWRGDVVICAVCLHGALLLWAALVPVQVPHSALGVEVMEITLAYSVDDGSDSTAEISPLPAERDPVPEPLPAPDAAVLAAPVSAEAHTAPVLKIVPVPELFTVSDAALPAVVVQELSVHVPAAPPATGSSNGTQAPHTSGDINANEPVPSNKSITPFAGPSVPASTGVAAAAPSAGAAGRIEAKLLQRERATRQLAREAGRRGWRGLVEILVELDSSGRALSAHVTKSSGTAALDAAAVHAVLGFRFSPATQAGVAVPAKLIVPLQL